jgi:hypothetical protein
MFMQTSKYLGEKAMFTKWVAPESEGSEIFVNFWLLEPADYTPLSPEEGPVEYMGPRWMTPGPPVPKSVFGRDIDVPLKGAYWVTGTLYHENSCFNWSKAWLSSTAKSPQRTVL